VAGRGRDPHAALKQDVVTRVNREGFEAVLARLQWGKDDVGFSLHANPSSFGTFGLQKTDFLAYLGFQRSDRCPFTSFQRCYVRWVDEGYNVEQFVDAFHKAFTQLEKAESGLRACGFALAQPEGWGFFYGKQSGGSRNMQRPLHGDGHTAVDTKRMKATEDANFLFRFTFVMTDHGKGFVTHYRPKHPPLSSEMSSVFHFLGLSEFRQCPEFDFEPCYYRTLLFEQRGDSPFDRNTEFAHGSFDAHAGQFSPAIENLLTANSTMEAAGMGFLPIPRPAERNTVDIIKQIVRPPAPKPAKPVTIAFDAALPSNFDVAISFAGTERSLAERLAKALQAAGVIVFYDNFYPEQLWGKNLTAFLDEIYRKRAKFCVVFISKEYRERRWTSHELRSAQARALELKGEDYILPIRIDGTDLDGLPPNIGYVSVQLGIEKIAELLIAKLGS
jgi:TIR domain